MILSTEKARKFGIPAIWVYFTLTNTDIMSQIQKGPLKLKKTDRDLFSGKFLGINLQLEVLGDRQPLSDGEIHIVVDARLPMGLGKTNTVAHYRYQAIDHKSTMVDLRFHLETSGLIMFFYFLLIKNKIDTYLSNLLKEVEEISKLLCSNSDILKTELADGHLDRISKFRSVHEGSPILNNPTFKKEPIMGLKELTWDKELRELANLHKGFENIEIKLETELDRIKNAQDEVLVLISARRILESIVIQLCERFLKRKRGTEPLANIIDKLDKLDAFPGFVFNSMRNLNRLCNQAAHIKDFSSWQVKEALGSLCSIMAWYSSEWGTICATPDCGLQKNNIDKYKSICSAIFADNIVTKEEDAFLKKTKVELNISKEAASKIESKFISEDTQYQEDVAINQFKDLLEMLAGGEMNENVRAYLDKKIKELALSPERAQQIEKAYLGNAKKITKVI